MRPLTTTHGNDVVIHEENGHVAAGSGSCIFQGSYSAFHDAVFIEDTFPACAKLGDVCVCVCVCVQYNVYKYIVYIYVCVCIYMYMCIYMYVYVCVRERESD